MDEIHENFLKAIKETKLILVTINSKEKGEIERTCLPFDFGPSRKYRDQEDRYHFLDLDSPDGQHNLSVLPEQLLSLEILDKNFSPESYINWSPKWHLPRDWGEFS